MVRSISRTRTIALVYLSWITAASWGLTGCCGEQQGDGHGGSQGHAGAGGAAGDGGGGAGGGAGGKEPFAMRVVAQSLFAPMEITWGPDGYLWVTERVGKRVLRVKPDDGARSTAITVEEAFQSSNQDGLLGMALHPELLANTGHDYVYVAYTYDVDPGPAVSRRMKIRRYTYDTGTHALGAPLDVITELPASGDHVSGRLAFGPDQKLYFTIGDQGANKDDNKCAPNLAQVLPSAAEVNAQDWSKYAGKILRLDLDGSIPLDNPLLAGARSHVYSYGHRNAQGIVLSPEGKVYSDEHGHQTDDELNLIQAGKNYGWPNVSGYQDDKAYVYGDWSASSPTPCDQLAYDNYSIPASVPQQKETDFSHPDLMPPLMTFYTVENGYNFEDPTCAGASYICWPTIAPSSIDLYSAADGIPGWAGSLLVTSLKDGTVYRVKLNADGTSVAGQAVPHFKTTDRYRDLTIKPDSRTFYVITDNEGQARGPSGGYTANLDYPGSILEFKYTGSD